MIFLFLYYYKFHGMDTVGEIRVDMMPDSNAPGKDNKDNYKGEF